MPIVGERARGRGRAPRMAAWAALCVTLLAQGCAMRSLDDQRLSRYRPDAADRRPWAWSQVAEAGPTPSAEESVSDGAREPAGEIGFSRRLRKGGRLAIHLRGIPAPETMQDMIDDLGGVTLPLIGSVPLAGLTTPEAEKRIADAYLKSGYYTRITVIVVPEDEEYFVRGEVKREGRYSIAGDLTLLQAVATAGGYTDYANTRKIRIMREGEETQVVDAARIEKRRDPDPLVKPGDIIVIPRRWLW